MVGYFWAFVLGILVFGIGIGIGWNMRGSVKEKDHYEFQALGDKLTKLGWGIEEIKEKVRP
ncbi:hypothetical protein SAMN05877753_1236 [Bacillus oleivorans]|uniref:Uncharacterized protein n=1 Tax=Bacillus oleivorans TaxID=1448271 RepID=A0A285D824_9BACI|nr:hypothetical protein [Bacillus oleivorans]SNX75951.1 hypothetical protein SAMN05877753_1236 [Bacillus oleivorans]